MNSKAQRKKVPVKSIFHHVTRAKVYAILTLEALEGMMLELNHTLDQEYASSNFDIFDMGLRRFQGDTIYPTSHGDYLDRAVKSLAKELELPVNVELANAQAVKKVIMSYARGSSEQEKAEILSWLNENNDFITKSPRFDQLIDSTCMYFYKKHASQVCEDTLNFVRRSANELLRNKASKDAMKKRLTQEEDDGSLDKALRDNESTQQEYDGVTEENQAVSDDTDSDDDFVLGKRNTKSNSGKRTRNSRRDEDYDDKRMKHIAL